MALRRAVELRNAAGIHRTWPLNIFDFAGNHLKLRVQFFAGPSFEGMFAKEQNTILVPSERPQGRRAYSAAHEVGHWAFGHGSQIDEIGMGEKYNDKPEERLVNLFAGYLLMFPAAVDTALQELSVNLSKPTAASIYRLACWFGVGYTTIINHLRWTLGKLSSANSEILLRVELKTIRRTFSPSVETRHIFVASSVSPRTPIDLEVGDHVLFPKKVRWQNKCLAGIEENENGFLVEAVRSGISLVSNENGWSCAVRVMNRGFTGWAKYRHLENEESNDD